VHFGFEGPPKLGSPKGAAILNVAMIGAVTVGLNFDVTNLVLVAFAVWATNMRRR
jgi:hypothetical protein